MLEDKVLIWKLKGGDKEALRHIYEKYKDDLLSIAACLLNETEAAQDVLHDVFVSFIKSVKRFRLYGSLKNYLITCIVNRVRDRFRSRMYEVVGLDSTGPISSDINEPVEYVLEDEQLQRLSEALAALPLPQREVVVLHLRGQLKFREIAEMQSVSINTVQSRYLYGLEKLKSIMDGEVTE